MRTENHQLQSSPINKLWVPRKWIVSILPQNKLNLPVHVFVVDRFAPFEIDATSDLKGLLIVPRPTKLIENVFLREDSVQDSAALFNVSVLDEHCSRDEFHVTHFAATNGKCSVNRYCDSIGESHLQTQALLFREIGKQIKEYSQI